jgi:hypothetical protein
MEDKTYTIPPIGGKSILRSTGEEVEIVDFEVKERGDRTDEDWVTYIDSNGKEHIKEHLNLQLDFKPIVDDTWTSMFDWAKNNKLPTTRNSRIFEVAKELYINGNRGYGINEAVEVATNLVDKVGIETE